MTDYLAAQRHILLDMHVPDWDERLLADFDPVAMVDDYTRAGAQAVMVYCNSHVGLCYWPTKVGSMHRGIAGRDVVGETVRLLGERDIASCAYYSLNFNNWAYHEHPDWRIVAAAPGSMVGGEETRYGICCPNNPGFQDFQIAQVHELMEAYPFDAFFFDMMFWTDVCVCEHCREGWARAEAERGNPGAEIPETVDWSSPEWCRFQAFREQSLADRFGDLVAAVKSHRDVPVFCNAAPLPWGWRPGMSHALLDHCDLLGGDYLGTLSELFGFELLLAGLTPTRFQYMNAFTGYIGGASEIKSIEQQTVEHALPAAVAGGQYMAIDAVEPNGRVNSGAYEQLAEVFEAMAPFDGLLPGRPIADVAVYWSMTSGVDFAESGTPLSESSFGMMLLQPQPHLLALNGVVASARGRLPVGVITRKDLARLAEYPVVVLPNVLRTDDEEVEAFRAYVANGGRLIASGYTSLVDPDGTRHDDFRLADVFGCHFGAEDTRAVSYARPLDPALAQAIAPRDSIVFGGLPSLLSMPVHAQSLSVTADDDAEVLVALTLPYADGRGAKGDQGWASIHASPPFEDTDRPVVIRHRYGQGEVVYLAGDLDATAARRPPAASLMLQLLKETLPHAPTFELEGDPAVWAVAYRLPEDAGVRLAILNHPESLPARPTREVRVRMSAGAGSPFTTVKDVCTGDAIAFERDGEDGIRFALEGIDGLVVLEAAR